MLKGTQVILRRVERKDIELLRLWRTSKEVFQFFSGKEQLSELQQENWFDKISRGSEHQYFIIEDTQHAPLGVCNISHIDWTNRTATWGIYFPSDPAIKTAAIEASILLLDYGFDTLNLNKIYSDVLSTNTRMLEFGIGIGFQLEGTQRKHVYHFGQYIDLKLIGIFREEFHTATSKMRKSLRL